MNTMGLIRLRKAARAAGVHTSSIIRWQESGWLTDHRTVGGHRRVDEDELKALLKRKRVETRDRVAK